MALKICSLSSGSSGNCIYVASDKTTILIDAGISVSQINRSLKVLGADFSNLNVLVTHTHSDHIKELGALVRGSNAAVYKHYAADVSRINKINYTEFDTKEFCIGDISITPFLVSHDVPCVGFNLRSGTGSISVLTDLGTMDKKVYDSISSSDILFIESNYDESMLKNGSYPQFLKRRIAGDRGHLSNTFCAKVCTRVVANKARQIILGHVSHENNTHQLALDCTKNMLNKAGAKEGSDYNIEVAPRFNLSGLYSV